MVVILFFPVQVLALYGMLNFIGGFHGVCNANRCYLQNSSEAASSLIEALTNISSKCLIKS